MQRGIKGLLDRFDVWKASRRTKRREYINEDARYVEERIVSLLLVIKFIFSLTC